MSSVFRTKRRGEMLRYSRPKISSYEDVNGDTISVAPNVPRFEYKDGYPHGLKLGDGDSARIPLLPNEAWPVTGKETTVIVTANAPTGKEFIFCGDLTVTGHMAMKTEIFHLSASESLMPIIEVFPSGDELPDGEEAHLLIFKYYGEHIDFDQYEEKQAMDELNDFLHGEWSLPPRILLPL